ncbi:FecR family protein [Steroidobacter sp.]|uniref:FecR family protein n=1 Tax=Steroidobacter sp. TaxID=1978227 RepID=UPI001A611943|nr:FecR family protein [Steroidobacter sp.]MBL8270618.1 FecR family protein [Steroidobacter sp.]
MTIQQSEPNAERLVQAEAAAWLAKLHGPERSAELEADFRAWLSSSPRSAAAFEHITEIWDSLGTVDLGGVPRMAKTSVRSPAPVSRFMQVAVACMLVVAIGVVGWFWQGTSYSTDIGEQRVVTLADGSRLSLNSSTQARIEYDDQQRVVRLDQGEAYFEVAKNAARPFIVIAGPRTITAVGTAFVVRHEAEKVVVTLVEGKVRVSSLDDGASLQPGERLTVHGAEQRKDTPQPHTIASWRRGEVELDYTPLQEAVEEMNRYDRTRLVLVDADVGELRVSGMYRIGTNRDFARAIAVVYGLNVTESDGQLLLSKDR